MELPALFTEKQKFRQWWLWTMLLGANALCLYGVFRQVIGKHPFGEKPASDAALIAAAAGVILVTLLFASFRLETKIQKDGIYIRFFPFHFSFRHYTWDQLSQTYLREYSAIKEYGGWGIRAGIFGKGKAYSVSGNMGLQLEFKDGKRLLIGTNQPDELEAVLKKLGQLKQ